MAGRQTGKRRTNYARSKWIHRSIKALLAKYGRRGEPPDVVIRRRARDLVAWAKKNQWDGPPYSPYDLASLLDIRDVNPTSNDAFAHGCIYPDGDGRFIIMYDERLPEERQRFSIFHEIAHTLFPDFATGAQYRFKDEEYDPAKAQFEQLCNIAAGELMLPHDDFLAKCADLPFGMQSMDSLRPVFEASLEAVLYRLTETTSTSCAVAFLAPGVKKVRKGANPKPEDIEHKWRIQYHKKTACFPESITKGKTVPDDSVVLACKAGKYSIAQETWRLTKKLNVKVEATALPPTPEQPQRAAAIITLR